MYENPLQWASTSLKCMPESVVSALYVATACPASIESIDSAVTDVGIDKVLDSPTVNFPTFQVTVSPCFSYPSPSPTCISTGNVRITTTSLKRLVLIFSTSISNFISSGSLLRIIDRLMSCSLPGFVSILSRTHSIRGPSTVYSTL